MIRVRLLAAINEVFAVSFLVAMELLSLGCNLGPDHPTAPGPIVKFTVSGTVSEVTPTGLAPLEGALVREHNSRVQAITDHNGSYVLSEVYGATGPVTVARNGYVSTSKTLSGEVDTRLDFQVDRITTYVLSGIVFEVANGRRVPVPEVELFCDDCGSADGHTFASTDANGFYSFSWAIGPTELDVTKAGYRLADQSRSETTTLVNVNSDTRLDIELVRN